MKSKADGRFQVEVRQRGVIAIPAKLRKEMGINEGDTLWIKRDGDRIILTPTNTKGLTALRGLALRTEQDDE